MTTPRIAVIGAGMAGLSCARHLQDAGCLVTVFDKGAAPGGRMSTRRGDSWQADHGAQYFTARDSRFVAELRRWEAVGVAAAWRPSVAVLGGSESGIENGRHAEADSAPRYVGVPRMSEPAAWMASALQVQNRVTIKDIWHDGQGWRLHSAELGLNPEHFDALLLAIPAPQAAILLEPLLPLTAMQAGAVGMQACWTLMMRFEQPYAPGYDAAFVNQGPLCWIARDSSKPGRRGEDVWVAQASAEWSEEHVELPQAQVAALLTSAWTALGGPRPLAVTAHRWRHARAVADSGRHAVWLPAVQVGLCGDWLYGARVEDAWLSGRELAAQVAAALMPQAAPARARWASGAETLSR